METTLLAALAVGVVPALAILTILSLLTVVVAFLSEGTLIRD